MGTSAKEGRFCGSLPKSVSAIFSVVGSHRGPEREHWHCVFPYCWSHLLTRQCQAKRRERERKLLCRSIFRLPESGKPAKTDSNQVEKISVRVCCDGAWDGQVKLYLAFSQGQRASCSQLATLPLFNIGNRIEHWSLMTSGAKYIRGNDSCSAQPSIPLLPIFTHPLAPIRLDEYKSQDVKAQELILLCVGWACVGWAWERKWSQSGESMTWGHFYADRGE